MESRRFDWSVCFRAAALGLCIGVAFVGLWAFWGWFIRWHAEEPVPPPVDVICHCECSWPEWDEAHGITTPVRVTVTDGTVIEDVLRSVPRPEVLDVEE